jgi:hypothetical protein
MWTTRKSACRTYLAACAQIGVSSGEPEMRFAAFPEVDTAFQAHWLRETMNAQERGAYNYTGWHVRAEGDPETGALVLVCLFQTAPSDCTTSTFDLGWTSEGW